MLHTVLRERDPMARMKDSLGVVLYHRIHRHVLTKLPSDVVDLILSHMSMKQRFVLYMATFPYPPKVLIMFRCSQGSRVEYSLTPGSCFGSALERDVLTLFFMGHKHIMYKDSFFVLEDFEKLHKTLALLKQKTEVKNRHELLHTCKSARDWHLELIKKL